MPTDLTPSERVPTMPRTADNDATIIQLWLHGRSPHTQAAYTRDVARFTQFCPRSLATITLGDIQAFADSLHELAPASRKRVLSAVKSLYTFAQKTGYLQYNV